MNRISDKIGEIEKYLQELSETIPVNIENYKGDFKARAACERYFERIIEAIIDLAFFMIKEYRLKTPEEDRQAFDILEQEMIISDKLAEKMRDAKGMRNIIAHEYGIIDDEMVFDSIKNELVSDAEDFVKQIKDFLRNKK
ncbi:MAG: DUF86 domain-containing protein [Candidatus Pacearchaeota archaeon]